MIRIACQVFALVALNGHENLSGKFTLIACTAPGVDGQLQMTLPSPLSEDYEFYRLEHG